jgi:serine/threonine protein phosphatase PrpC
MPSNSEADTAEVPLLPRPAPDATPVTVEVDLHGLSHLGLARPNNEDSFLISRFGRYLEVVQSNLPRGATPAWADVRGFGLVVADGIGGSEAGEEASRIAIAGLVRLVLETPDWILRLDDVALLEEAKRRTAVWYDQVGRIMAAESQANPALAGYGTTLTVAFSVGPDLFVGHVGDSRAYLFRDGHLGQLTRDHTVAQRLVDQKHIDRVEAAAQHLRSVLTQCLGDHARPVMPDVSHMLLQDGDSVLVCTDGLTDMVPDDAIAAALAGGAAAQPTCQTLVDLALAAGGRDNVTVAVARYRIT